MKISKQYEDVDSTNLTLADRLDMICDEFEVAWLSATVPNIKDFLNRCAPVDRERLLAELLLVDREYRIKRGERVTRLDYQRLFPDYSTIIGSLEFATFDDHNRGRSLPRRISRGTEPGGRFSQFELITQLGAGASGVVWKARDTRLRRVVAIKFPRHEKLSASDRERFLREGQASAQLRHPNIVAVYDVGEEHGIVFIVAEFINGVTLREWMRERRPKPRDAAELTAQLAEALHHAHEQGIIHRDLKPANVLLDDQRHPHITDFGLAKWTADSAQLTVEGDVLGTPAYMSPEQARGEAFQVDRRSDVYGLGALLYEMLTGRPPFGGKLSAIVHQVIHDELIRPRKVDENVPRDLETICLKAMDKEPNRRYPSAQEMAVDLRRYLRDESILARRASLVEKSWRWLRRRPALAVALVLAILVVMAGIAIASLQQKNYRLQGYRPVLVKSTPEGARVAFVPIDPRTGEPNPDPDGIVRPRGKTPVRTLLKPGNYFVEVVLPGDGVSSDFAEAYTTVTTSGMLSEGQMQRNRNAGDEEDLFKLEIAVPRMSDVIADMVTVPVDEELRRKNSLLPEVLYVDAKESTPSHSQNRNSESTNLDTSDKNNGGVTSFEYAKQLAGSRGRRLPSAIEYDAIVKAAKERELRYITSGLPAVMNDLFGGLAEWTTTTYDARGGGQRLAVTRLRKMHVLKGYGDLDKLPGLLWFGDGYLLASPESDSPMIGFRGVRSGEPRFVKP